MIAVTLRKVLTPYLMPHLLELEHLFCEPKAPSMVSWLAVPGRHPGEPRVVADNVVHRERPQVWHDGLLAVTAGALLAQCPWSKCRFNRDASGVSLAASAQRGEDLAPPSRGELNTLLRNDKTVRSENFCFRPLPL